MSDIQIDGCSGCAAISLVRSAVRRPPSRLVHGLVCRSFRSRTVWSDESMASGLRTPAAAWPRLVRYRIEAQLSFSHFNTFARLRRFDGTCWSPRSAFSASALAAKFLFRKGKTSYPSCRFNSWWSGEPVFFGSSSPIAAHEYRFCRSPLVSVATCPPLKRYTLLQLAQVRLLHCEDDSAALRRVLRTGRVGSRCPPHPRQRQRRRPGFSIRALWSGEPRAFR